MLRYLLATIAATQAAEVTFHKDVMPILQAKCHGCHRPGEAAPMSFLSYSSTRPFAKAMREAVLAKRMPPWSADAPHGTFRNDPSLSAGEIETLVNWADGGAKEGDPKQAPAAVAFVDGWNIGKPDAVFTMPEPYEVPASGVIDYQFIIVPTGLQEDKWVKAVEIRPGRRDVVHHAIAFVRPPGSKWLRDAQPGVPYAKHPQESTTPSLPTDDMPEYLLSYTPGRPPTALEAGQARLIKAGSDIVFQLHYTTNGKVVRDQTKIGLVFADRAPMQRVATLPIANRTFAIPPGDPRYAVNANGRVVEPARMTRIIPHMHLRGKAFEVAMVEPSGARRTLLKVPKYDFRWQHAYELKEPVELKPGARIECTGWYDNSPNNPDNPDPKKTVRWGDQSWDEMMLNYVDVAVTPGAEPWNVLARPAAAAQSGGSVKEKFYGVYRLLSFENRLNDGRVEYPYGRNVIGRITYDRQGRMSALLLNADRPKPASVPASQSGVGTWRTATEADMRATLSGFVAYNGLFDVDETKGVVIHHVKAALNANWIGTDLIRSYSFEGNRLSLTVQYPTSKGVLIWEREPD